jgi:hypothetical protein
MPITEYDSHCYPLMTAGSDRSWATRSRGPSQALSCRIRPVELAELSLPHPTVSGYRPNVPCRRR